MLFWTYLNILDDVRCSSVAKRDISKEEELLPYFDEICGEETGSDSNELTD